MHHFVERGRNQPAQPNHIHLVCPGFLQNPVGWYHHPEINHVVIVAGQDDAYNVFADVVHISFHGRQKDACFLTGIVGA